MKKPFIQIDRLQDQGTQTIGILSVVRDFTTLFRCKTLELGWHQNGRNISCIPSGLYKCKKHHSARHGDCILVEDVPDRDAILFHAGNFNSDTRGCILVGEHFKKLNNDTWDDLTNSDKTMKTLLTWLPDEFDLNILPAK